MPAEAERYVLLNGTIPLYVVVTDNLNKRLNTSNGSRDNFANQTRPSDAERNFIKKFCNTGVITALRVLIIRESSVSANRLQKLDRKNVEKVLSLFRTRFTYL